MVGRRGRGRVRRGVQERVEHSLRSENLVCQVERDECCFCRQSRVGEEGVRGFGITLYNPSQYTLASEINNLFAGSPCLGAHNQAPPLPTQQPKPLQGGKDIHKH